MNWTTNARSVAASWAEGWRSRLSVSDEAKVRAMSAVVWVLVVLAALAGTAAWLRPDPRLSAPEAQADGQHMEAAWEAAGFGARFVAAYLTAGPEADLASFLGYSPDLSETLSAGRGEFPEVAVVGVDSLGEGYWAVTVAARQAGRDDSWRVGVAEHDGHLVIAALPTPVPTSSAGDPVELLPPLSAVPGADDPLVQAVAGFVAAYSCGDGDVARYVAPGVDLKAVKPAICQTVRVDRWGAWQQSGDRQVVLAEVLLDPGPNARQVAFPLVLARRADRWEVAQLLLAPAIAGASLDLGEAVQ